MPTISENPNRKVWNPYLREIVPEFIESACSDLVLLCHGAAVRAGWYNDILTGAPIKRNVGELLMLIVSELGEAMEAQRKELMDDHLPNRLAFEVEIADTLIRLFDLCGALGLDIGNAMAEKLEFNRTRADHKPEARRAAGGKKC